MILFLSRYNQHNKGVISEANAKSQAVFIKTLRLFGEKALDNYKINAYLYCVRRIGANKLLITCNVLTNSVKFITSFFATATNYITETNYYHLHVPAQQPVLLPVDYGHRSLMLNRTHSN